MVLLMITAFLVLLLIYHLCVKPWFLEKKLFAQLKKSPDLNILLNYAEKIGIKFIPFDIFIKEKDEYRWSAGFYPDFIRVSLDRKTKEILPPDPFLKKIIFAHELGHIIQEKKWIEILERCDPPQKDDSYLCFYFEIEGWREGFLLLEKLNLFHNDKERKNFWDYANATLKNKKFTPCWRKIRDGECPKTLELRPRIPKGGLD